MRCDKLENGVAKQHNDEIYCPSDVKCQNKDRYVVYHSKPRMNCSPCKSCGHISDIREKGVLI